MSEWLIQEFIVTMWKPLSAAEMSAKLLVPEPPSNYKISITRSYDPAINWQITVLDNGDLYASGKETDANNQSNILNGDVWLREGLPGQSGDDLTLGDAFGMAETVYFLYPYTLVPEAGNLPAMIDELADQASMASNPAIQELQTMHNKRVEQAINENIERMPDDSCGDSTCSVFRQAFSVGEGEGPGHADYYVDDETGYVRQILSFHEAAEVDGEAFPAWTETALFEYNVNVQWPDGSG